MLHNTEGAIQNVQSRETGNIGHTRRRKTDQHRPKPQHNMRWTPLCAMKHKQRIQDMIPPTNNWR
jgi:hypothetical protein